ncbi:MAG: thiamine-phosphate kinase [Myxococcota bacterium]
MSAKTLGDIGEAEVIRIFAEGGPPPGPRVVVENGDDAFAFAPRPDHAVVATTDSLVEGTHFLLKGRPREIYLPEDIGRKLMRANLSDLAAMGADPVAALISVHASLDIPVELAQGIARGIAAEALAHEVYIAGGNVTRIEGPLVLAATLIGEVRSQAILRKNRAQEGDRIFVTGTLGDARLGLLLSREPEELDQLSIQPADAAHVLSALHRGRAAVIAGMLLTELGFVHAVADISDGLARDLERMLRSRGLGARVDRSAIPLSAAAQRVGPLLGVDPTAAAVLGGEDYELLITVAPSDGEALQAALDNVAIEITEIGEVTRGPRIEIEAGQGLEGFDHFRKT